MTERTFDDLFDAAKDTESFEIEQLCFEVAHSLADRLSELAPSGMSQRKLARTLNVTDVYVSRVLHGQPANMTLGTIVKFARALDCRVVPPKIVPRQLETAVVVLGEREAMRNLPRSWANTATVVPAEDLRRLVAAVEKSEGSNVTGTAA